MTDQKTEKFSIEFENGITTIRFSDDFSLKDIRQAMDVVASRNVMNEKRMWILGTGTTNLSGPDLQQLAEYSKSIFLLPSRVAIVAPETLVFGLSRIYTVYREEGLTIHKVFRSEQAARDWLSVELIQ